MNIIQTALNERLAKSVRRRAVAEQSLIFGKVGFWYLVAIGLIFFGIGSAVGFGFYGYSHIIKNTDQLTILSSILSESLSKVHLQAKAEGTVRLDPPDLHLAPGQTISLANDSRVSLEQSSTVTANGEIKVELPSVSVPPVSAGKASGKPALITNFTVFKSVQFGKGAVMTGWVFLTSAQTLPTHQYCYYTASLETPGFDISVDVGQDGVLDATRSLPSGFDIKDAFDRCVWFRSKGQ